MGVPDRAMSAPRATRVGAAAENGGMGRGDGSGRVVSAPGADDSGAGILHVDMDAFYASVESLDRPELAGRPVIVGGARGRGVVASASYEARRFGVRSAMPMARARSLCPAAVVVPPRIARYREVSETVFGIFREFTPVVEPLSIDEAFLDVSGARRLWGGAAAVADRLRQAVRSRAGLACSVGGGATKHVAKIASAMSKPDGVLIVAAADTADFLAPLPVRAVWGVGPRAAQALEARGVRTIGDLRDAPASVVEHAVGAVAAQRIQDLARGRDPRPVTTARVEKSAGHEETFDVDVADTDRLHREIRRLADRVGERLRAMGAEAAAVTVTVRFADFRTVTRTARLSAPTSVGERLGRHALSVFDGVERPLPVRLVGVRAEGLRPAAADTLWDEDESWRRAEAAIDGAADRFGAGAVLRASGLVRGADRVPGPGPGPARPQGRDGAGPVPVP